MKVGTGIAACILRREGWRWRFYAGLNDFLPPDSQGKQARRHFDVVGTVKDLIESFGVPAAVHHP